MEEIKSKNSNNKSESASYNRNNVNNIKKMIILTFIAMFVLPVLFCMYLMTRVNEMEEKLDDISNKLEAISPDVSDASEKAQLDSSDYEFLDQVAYDNLEVNTTDPSNYLAKPDSNAASSNEGNLDKEGYIDTNSKRVYLTFDDGPSENTDDILDILADNDVKATFFVCYTSDEELWPMYNRIVEEGHTLGMHSYSHVYDKVYASKASFIDDVSSLHDFLLEQTGVDSKYYRFPGGSSNTVSSVDIQELIKYLYSQDIEYYDWNAMSGDAVTESVSPYELNMNVLTYVRDNENDSMVLMHDLTAIPETVQGLDSLIKQLKSEGYEFCAIESNTTPVQHVKFKGNK